MEKSTGNVYFLLQNENEFITTAFQLLQLF